MVNSCNLVYRPGSQIRVTSAAHPNKHVHPESRKRHGCEFVAIESICAPFQFVTTEQSKRNVELVKMGAARWTHFSQ